MSLTATVCRAFAVALLLLFSSIPVAAEEARLAPGVYLTEGGWGDLTITRSKDGRLSFKIFAIGGNAHTCDLGGEIKSNKAILVEGEEKEKPCIVRFIPKGSGITVSVETADACRYYCGMRAGFEGTYVKPAAACLPKAVTASRANFKRLYDRKAFSDAAAILEATLRDCVKTVNWLDMGWIRNDLALTYHKLGRDDLCLQQLKGLEADAAKSDRQLGEDYPPTDAENYLPVVRAARTNLKLCRGGKN